MKPVRLFLLSLSVAALSVGAGAQETFTITQCYDWARGNYPQIKQYGLIDRTESYNLSNAGKAWLPQLTLNAKATYQSAVTQLPFDTEKMSALIPGFDIPTMSKDQYQVVAEVNQTIWDGGATSATRQITRAQAEADRRQTDADLYALNDRVNQLFFGCLLQDDLLTQNALLQKELQVNIDRISALMTNGMANESDLESMQVELLNARQKEIELRASRQAYRQMLGTLVGRPIAEADRLETPSSGAPSLSPVINRPELHALDARNVLLDTQDKQITAGLIPRLGAFVQGGYGRPGLNMLENEFSAYYMAGIRLSWNIGKFYTLKNDRRKLDTNKRMVDLQRDIFLFNTNLTLIQQNAEVKKMTELMRADDDIIRLRTSIRKAAEAKLENGVISVTDLIREINAEDMALQTAATHRVQQLLSIYNYRYTTD